MSGGLLTESSPVRVGLDFGLSETQYPTRLEPKAMKTEPARIDAVVAPSGIALAQVEELSGSMSVPVEVDFERGLLSAGQSPRQTAGATQEIVEAGGERRIVSDFRRDLCAYVSGVGHGLQRRA